MGGSHISVTLSPDLLGQFTGYLVLEYCWCDCRINSSSFDMRVLRFVFIIPRHLLLCHSYRTGLRLCGGWTVAAIVHGLDCGSVEVS